MKKGLLDLEREVEVSWIVLGIRCRSLGTTIGFSSARRAFLLALVGAGAASDFAGEDLWSFARIEKDSSVASRLLDMALKSFSEKTCFFAICAGLEKVKRGLSSLDEMLRTLLPLSEGPGRSIFYELLFNTVSRHRLGKKVMVEEIENAARQKWERWRTAQVRKLRISRLA